MKISVVISFLRSLLRPSLSLIIALMAVFWSPEGRTAVFSRQQALCRQSLMSKERRQQRLEIISDPHIYSRNELINALKLDGRLIFKGSHQHVPGTEFLASNEFDWTLTPFDHKESDVLIAFGTNSAWEIAADKNIKELILADWSPNPIIAQAYLWTPFWRIAQTPTELVLLMGGIIPTPDLATLDITSALQLARHSIETRPDPTKAHNLFEFMQYLGKEPLVTDLELQVINSYFLSALDLQFQDDAIGPFHDISLRQALNILSLMDLRYNQNEANLLNPGTRDKEQVYYKQSILHNFEMFERVKALYSNNSVRYALTTVTNPEFYQSVHRQYPAPNTRFALSITNIFECGYAHLTFFDLQHLLKETSLTLKASSQSPLVVFRTTNYQPPHGFYRYDITSEFAVLKEDEADSKASHIPDYSRVKNTASGF